jgi:hypothetical protein
LQPVDLLLLTLIFIVAGLLMSAYSTKQRFKTYWTLAQEEKSRLQEEVQALTDLLSELQAPKKPQKRGQAGVAKKVIEPKQPEPEPIPAAMPIDQPVIVTRTSRGASGAIDTWTTERKWTKPEVDSLVGLYLEGLGVHDIAQRLQVDSRDVVFKIARHVFRCRGELDDKESAPNDGRRWSQEHREKLRALLGEGLPVSKVAAKFGRTQLAVVWQVIDLGNPRPRKP